MHILINGMFWHQPNTGSGQYLHGLLHALPAVAPKHRVSLVVPSIDRRRWTVERGTLPAPSTVHRPPSTVTLATPFDGRSNQLAKLWFEQIGLPLAARQIGADVVFVPYAAAPLVAPLPVVTTVHDIIWHLLPEYRGSKTFQAYTRLVIAATRRAAHVIADSEHSRQDIITHLGLPPERVSTVLLAAGVQYRPLDREAAQAEVAARYGLDRRFVYYVGGLDARKNVPTLLRAWAKLQQSGGPAATLAIAGRALGTDRRLFPDLDGLIAELGVGNSVRRLDVPQHDNPLLYNAASVFAAPSRYEGFGLGPLEAMACGTPVVCSNASSLPEVVGDAALLVDPLDVSGWASALWRLLADRALQNDLRARGLEQAARFSYQHVAQHTVALLEQAAR